MSASICADGERSPHVDEFGIRPVCLWRDSRVRRLKQRGIEIDSTAQPNRHEDSWLCDPPWAPIVLRAGAGPPSPQADRLSQVRGQLPALICLSYRLRQRSPNRTFCDRPAARANRLAVCSTNHDAVESGSIPDKLCADSGGRHLPVEASIDMTATPDDLPGRFVPAWRWSRSGVGVRYNSSGAFGSP